MAALANPPEATCSHCDHMFAMCSTKPGQNIALHRKMFTLTSVFLNKTLFHFEPSLNQFHTKKWKKKNG